MSTSNNTPENSETSHANTDNAAAHTNERIVFGSYTGHIDGPRQAQRLVYEAPPQSRDGQPSSSEASVTSIIKTSVGSMDNSCYLLAVDNDAVLIDAATDAPFLLDLADAAGVKITDVITTHSHYDHVGALKEVLQQTEARHHASAGDAPDLPADADRVVKDGERFDLASEKLADLHLSGITLHGHTNEGLAIAFDPQSSLGIKAPVHVFTGDSLFPGGVGKTSSPEAFNRLLDDVTHKLFDVYDGATCIHPGHGDDTTLGAEYPHLAEWRERGW